MPSVRAGSSVIAVIVQQGKILDFIDGETQRKETLEEYVRQEIAKSLVREYEYPKATVAVEFKVKLGSSSKRADLVIFPDGADHKQENAWIIVECKKKEIKPADKSDGVEQLKSYLAACPNARFGMWTNGVERICIHCLTKDGKRIPEEIPDIPTFGHDEIELDRPSFDQLKPATSDALLFAFRRCHNHIAGNQGMQKPQAFWELLKLIFCKIWDEKKNPEIEFYAAAAERHGMNGPLKVRDRIAVLFDQVKEEYKAIFDPADTLKLEPKVLAYLVSQLQMYSLLESDIDVKGRAYEEIVGSNLRGDRGEFFTPRNACQLAVTMLAPTEKDHLLDPACGTGGFLITAMNHVIKQIQDQELVKWKGDADRAAAPTRERIKRYAGKFISGLDFNPELVKATKMNMVMNNDGSGGLFQANSLENPVSWSDELRAAKLIGKIDLLFTNPPFGSKIPISDPSILEQYDLGYSWGYDADDDTWTKTDRLQKSQPPEILFIERCVQFLKPGGRCALVLPDGILGSPGLGYVRDWILKNTRILASIDLHPDTFQPHVSVQTSLLVLERKPAELIALETAAGRLNDYNIFMAVANHIGHDKRGNKTYVRDKDGSEIVEEVERDYFEWEHGKRIVRKVKVREKIADDNTQQIAQNFRTWLSEQD